MSELNASRYGESLITPLAKPTGSAWWTTGKKNKRMSALGATSIVVLLALITWLVWISPTDNVVRKVVGDVVKPISTNLELKNDRADLLTQLVSTKSTISDQSAELTKLKAQLAAANGKSDALEAKLSKAMAAESKSAAQVKDYKSQLAAAGSGAASSGTASSTAAGSTDTTGDTAGGASGGTTTTPSNPVTGPVTVQTPTLASLKSPTSKYFGLYTQQAPFSWAENDDVASKVGENSNLSGYFQGWDTDFRADAVQRAWAKGEMPLLTWESQPLNSANNDTDQSKYSLGNIIDGDFDAYLTKYAKAIAANKQPLGIRLDQEMNADWYPWGENTNGNSKGQFATMWKHVHDIFQANGANDYVVWIWSPNRVNNLAGEKGTQAYLQNYYPGDQYVDWVGMSAYLRPPYSNSETYSFEHTFSSTLSQLRAIAPGKPIYLSEIGASEIGGQKAKWITDLFANLALPENSDIIGFGWFNFTKTSTTNGVQYTNDWRITSSSSATTAFKNGLASVSSLYNTLKPAS